MTDSLQRSGKSKFGFEESFRSLPAQKDQFHELLEKFHENMGPSMLLNAKRGRGEGERALNLMELNQPLRSDVEADRDKTSNPWHEFDSTAKEAAHIPLTAAREISISP